MLTLFLDNNIFTNVRNQFYLKPDLLKITILIAVILARYCARSIPLICIDNKSITHQCI